jgi:predicted esterase
MKKETIEVTRTARYFLLGEPGAHIRRVWFVCHGYGQLADQFLSNFEVLNDGHTLVAAPEGLHRFYLPGAGQQVGASWMTKEERLTDIADYIRYLDTVYTSVMERLGQSPSELKIDTLGFSQGAATAWRWTLRGGSIVHRLILWGGEIPPEAHWESCAKRLEQTRLLLVFGNKDPLMKPGLFEKQKQLLDQHKITFRSETFDGYHEIKPEALVKLK